MIECNILCLQLGTVLHVRTFNNTHSCLCIREGLSFKRATQAYNIFMQRYRVIYKPSRTEIAKASKHPKQRLQHIIYNDMGYVLASRWDKNQIVSNH
jgi:hypothetical protein